MLTYFKKANLAIALILVIGFLSPTNANADTVNLTIDTQTGNNLPNEWQNYVDSDYGFQVGYPIYGWTGAIAFQNETQADDVIIKRFTIRNDDFAFINVDVWNNSAGLTIPEWIDLHQKSLLDTTATIPTTNNITISGTDGFIIVQPPNLEQQLPGRIITVLSNNGFIYRIEYIAQDGGAAQDLYISVLETFEFEPESALPDNLPEAPFFGDQTQNQTQKYIQAKAYAQAQSLSSSCCGLTDPQYNPYPCDSSTGNCTWYAAYARDDLPYQNQIWGNAKDWITYARNEGFSTGKTPKVGAIVVLQPGVQYAGSIGHVA